MVAVAFRKEIHQRAIYIPFGDGLCKLPMSRALDLDFEIAHFLEGDLHPSISSPSPSRISKLLHTNEIHRWQISTSERTSPGSLKCHAFASDERLPSH